MIAKLAGRWLDFEAHGILTKILCASGLSVNGIQIDRILNTGHMRKVIVIAGNDKYVCHLSLRRQYCDILSELHTLARNHGVPLATVRNAGTYWRGPVPVHYVVLGWVPGSPCGKKVNLSLEQLTELGRIFGRLHSIRSDQWRVGGVEYPRRFDNCRNRIDDWISVVHRFAQLNDVTSPDVVHHFSSWLNRKDNFVKSMSEHRLVHGDAHGNNVVVNEENLSLIDTDGMLFDFAPFELFRCLMANYNEKSVQRQSVFLQGYYEEVDGSLWMIWKEHMVCIAALSFLMLAGQRLTQSRRLRDSDRSAHRYRTARIYWNTFLRLTTECSAKPDTLVEIMAVHYDARQGEATT